MNLTNHPQAKRLPTKLGFVKITLASLFVAFVSACTVAPVAPVAPTVLANPIPSANTPPNQPKSASDQPESSSGYTAKTAVTAREFIVATANPLSTEAAYDILAQGGSAVDAAIAAQMVLTLVEPQSSGIGGGAFLMAFDKKTKQTSAWDGRETAPAAANENLFIGSDGKPLKFAEALVGGRSVGTPGALRMLAAAHKEHGVLPWQQLFVRAISLAKDGFLVSPRLNSMLIEETKLALDANAAAYFYDAAGKPWPTGHRLKNPKLASTLERIANEGPDAFYIGAIAQKLVAAVQNHPTNPGRLSIDDLRNYQMIKREALCTPALAHLICGFPPPSSGGIAVAQILSILEASKAPALLDQQGQLSSQGIHWFSEAGRLAFADRNQYIADPAFANWPRGLLSKTYLSERAQLIKPNQSLLAAKPGQPNDAISWTREATLEQVSTSHLAIIDKQGNAVSMTTTIEAAFGSRMMVEGFLLNNQLTDFSFTPSDAQGQVANRVQAGKRPRSSMAPTIVFNPDGTLRLVVGSPGGSLIINFVSKVLVANLRDGIDIQKAIDLPNFGSRNGPTEIESAILSPALQAQLLKELKEIGHEVRVIDMTSGLQGLSVQVDASGRKLLTGGADPRREGKVMGR